MEPAAPAPPVAPGVPGKDAPATPAKKDTATALDEQRRRMIDRVVAKLPAAERENARAEFEKEFGKMTPEEMAPLSKLVEDPCAEGNLRLDIGELGDKYEPRLREACRKIVADAKSFGRALFQNTPKMMFIFLPLIAALMFVLYLGSGRYYVEHLLFFVHYHAFFFVCGLAVVVLSRLATLFEGYSAAAWFDGAENVLITVLIFYVPYYLYRAMRRVYGQGRWVTLAKFSLLGVGYLFFMTLTAIGLLFYTALTL